MTSTDTAPEVLRASSRILAAWHLTGRSDLDSHLSVHGQLPLRRSDHRFASQLLEYIRASGLSGRGGAGFPTARKWESLHGARRPLLVVNAMEGEPESMKNAALVSAAPHLLLDGSELAAVALGATEAAVCVPDDRPDSANALRAALDERAKAGVGLVEVRVLTPPRGYVTGEESALVNWVGGGEAVPGFRPDKAVPLAIGRRPVLVHNAETVAHVALIARHGPEWFRSVGLPDAPGTALVTLSGALEHPGVYEIELGEPISTMLRRAAPVSPLSALLVGGYGGAWLAPELVGTPFAPRPLAAVGGAMGPGIVVALPAGACGVAETTRVASYMAGESAGQCGPCTHGLPAIASDLTDLARGGGDRSSLARLRHHLDVVAGRGACGHPDGMVRFVRSALETFAADFVEHSRRRPCRGWQSPSALRVPLGDGHGVNDQCIASYRGARTGRPSRTW